MLYPQGDENVQAYKKALRESMQREYYHYIKTVRVSTVSGEWIDEDSEEFYKCGADLLMLNRYGNDVFYFMNYKGYNYNANITEAGKSVYIHNEMQPINNRHHDSYYSIIDKNVTYQETDSQFIVTYTNQSLIGKEPRAYKEGNKDGYTSAVSVAYFDKDWNIQRLEIRETWDSISQEGIEYERVREVAYEYRNASKEEIQKILEDEHKYINSLLEE